jgi:hypothetical protein
MTEKVPYITTESAGFRAFVDGYVLAEYGGSVCCLSVYGAVGAVQSLCASLVSGRDVQLWGNGEFETETKKKKREETARGPAYASWVVLR